MSDNGNSCSVHEFNQTFLRADSFNKAVDEGCSQKAVDNQIGYYNKLDAILTTTDPDVKR